MAVEDVVEDVFAVEVASSAWKLLLLLLLMMLRIAARLLAVVGGEVIDET